MIGLFAGKLGGMNKNVGLNLCQGVRGLGAFFEKIFFELNSHGPPKSAQGLFFVNSKSSIDRLSEK